MKSLRVMIASFLLIIASQASVLAAGNTAHSDADGLSAGQIVGGFAVLLFVILLPLVKSARKTANAK